MLKTSWFGRKNTSARSNDFSLVRIIPLHQRGWHCPGIPEEIPWKKYRDRQLDVVSSGFWVYQNRMGCQTLKNHDFPLKSTSVMFTVYRIYFFVGLPNPKMRGWGKMSKSLYYHGYKMLLVQGFFCIAQNAWHISSLEVILTFWDALVTYLPSISYKITGQHTACLFSRNSSKSSDWFLN